MIMLAEIDEARVILFVSKEVNQSRMSWIICIKDSL